MTEFKVGDRVRVIKLDECNFGDYTIGDEAIVRRVGPRHSDIWVTWITNLLGVSEGDRVELLFLEEVELVPES